MRLTLVQLKTLVDVRVLGHAPSRKSNCPAEGLQTARAQPRITFRSLSLRCLFLKHRTRANEKVGGFVDVYERMHVSDQTLQPQRTFFASIDLQLSLLLDFST